MAQADVRATSSGSVGLTLDALSSRVPWIRRAAYVLFPFSQLVALVFAAGCIAEYGLPPEQLAVVLAIAVCCIPVDFALLQMVRQAEKVDRERVRNRMLEQVLGEQEQQRACARRNLDEAEAIMDALRQWAQQLEAELEKNPQADDAHAQGSAKGALASLQAQARYCAHPIVNTLVGIKAQRFQKAGVMTVFDLRLPDALPFSDVEMCGIFSNLLDNAMHACENVAEGERFVQMDAFCDGETLVIAMRNSCSDQDFKRASRPQFALGRPGGESKMPKHGWGLSILRSLAARHGGSLSTASDEGVFDTRLELRSDASRISPQKEACGR